ncbi:hypothetical protein OQA88_7478 [Cercophora sp. LCS_1]
MSTDPELAHHNLVRVAFIFDTAILLDPSTNLPRSGVRSALTFLQKHHIPFIILSSPTSRTPFTTEPLLTTHLNNHLPLLKPLSQSLIALPTTPFRSLVPKIRQEDPVLIIASDPSHARHLAWSYGFEFVLTVEDVVAYYDDFASFKKGVVNPVRDRKVVIDNKAYWQVNSSRRLLVSQILVFSTPQPGNGDTEVVKHLLQNGGRLGYTGQGGDAPPLHVVEEAKGWAEGVVGRQKWGERGFSLYGGPPEGMRFLEVMLRGANDGSYREMIGKVGDDDDDDGEERIGIPRLRAIYLVGRGLEGRRTSSFGTSWKDVLLQGQDGDDAWFVAKGLGEVVEHSLRESWVYWTGRGLKCLWPEPRDV